MKQPCLFLLLVLARGLASSQEVPNPMGDGHINYAREYPTSTSPSPSAGRASIEKALSKMELRLWKDYADGTTRSIKEFITDDAKVSISNGAMSKGEWIARIESGECRMKSFRLTDFVLTVQGARSAEIRYQAEQDATCNGKLLPHNEDVRATYIKTPDMWRDGRWWEGEWKSISHRETTSTADRK